MRVHKTQTVEAVFHRAIKPHLTKRQQGYVMGAFREAALLHEIEVEQVADLIQELRDTQHELAILHDQYRLYPTGAVNCTDSI